MLAVCPGRASFALVGRVVISRMYARVQMREAELRFSVSAGSAQECLQNAEQYVRHVLGPGATEPWLKAAELRARTPVEYAAEITYAFFDHDDEERRTG
jgi:hypothetical protein